MTMTMMMNPKATPIPKNRPLAVRRAQKALSQIAVLTPAYVCPWCGQRHVEWVGDHIVPLAGLRSPMVAAGKKCNFVRRGEVQGSDSLGRLYRPPVPVASCPASEIKRFVKNWAKVRYGSSAFAGLAIADSGPAMRIGRRRANKFVDDPVLQQLADKAYLEFDGITENQLDEFRQKRYPVLSAR